MSKLYEELKTAYDSIKDRITVTPKVAIVLGSGLGEFAKNVENPTVIPYSEIEGFPVSTIVGHAGEFVIGTIKDVPVVVMSGRVHYYEGYPMQKVVMPIRLMKMMGAEILVLTNAAGAITQDLRRGDLMVINDHITSFVPSPLIGENVDELGTRFPDMTQVYSMNLYNLLKVSSFKNDINIKTGTYIQVSGPNYETPAEINMYKKLGANAVGMSTACEAMAAKHAGMQVCGISCITNLASGISAKPLSHKDVQETANIISTKFCNLIIDFVELTKTL